MISGGNGRWSDFVHVEAYGTYACYHPDLTGTTWINYSPISGYQLGLGTPHGILPTSWVLALKVLAGGTGSWLNYSALVDVVTLGQNFVPTVFIDEPNNSRSHFEVATRH